MVHFYALQIPESGQGVHIIKLFITVTLTIMSLRILLTDSLLKTMQSGTEYTSQNMSCWVEGQICLIFFGPEDVTF